MEEEEEEEEEEGEEGGIATAAAAAAATSPGRFFFASSPRFSCSRGARSWDARPYDDLLLVSQRLGSGVKVSASAFARRGGKVEASSSVTTGSGAGVGIFLEATMVD